MEDESQSGIVVWLDPSRGFLPTKHIYRARPGWVIVEFVTEEAIEVVDGLWMATKGIKRSRLPAAGPDVPWQYVWAMRVDVDDEGKHRLSINTGVEDDFFDLWKRLPLGTELHDRDVGTN